MIKNKNVFDDIKTYPDYFFNIIYTDPPYNLGSIWCVDNDGKYKIKKKSDFMNKWDGLDENDLDLFFKESFRIMKYGGYLCMFGMDRQLAPFQYYAVKNGFEVQQSLYWYNIQGFPKAADVSKMIDKRFNRERKVVGKKTGRASKPMTDIRGGNITNGKPGSIDCSDITEPNHDLAKKYDGYKYSVAPLKQVVETILVFRKPIKGNSILDDLIESENDKEISPSIINIDENRIKHINENDKSKVPQPIGNTGNTYGFKNGKGRSGEYYESNDNGRFPTQLFIQCNCDSVIIDGEDNPPFEYKENEYTVKGFINKVKPNSPSNYNDSNKKIIHTNPDCPCAKLDTQSGDRKGWSSQNHNKFQMYGRNSFFHSRTGREGFYEGYNDNGGVSRVLHQIRYDDEEMDLLFYNPKITGSERNEGLDEKYSSSSINKKCKKCGKWSLKQQHSDKYTCKCENPEWEGTLEKKERVFNGKSDKSSKDMKDVEKRFTTSPSANNHPTLKPIELINKISSLFKLPDECDQKVYIPFCGTFSEIIGFVKAGYKIDNIYGCEIDEYYYEIGQKRLEYFIEKYNKKSSLEKFL